MLKDNPYIHICVHPLDDSNFVAYMVRAELGHQLGHNVQAIYKKSMGFIPCF